MSEYTTYIEIPVTVHYDYQPEEKTVMYPNDKADPGCPESASINSIEFGGIDLLPQMTDWGYMEEEILESLRGDE